MHSYIRYLEAAHKNIHERHLDHLPAAHVHVLPDFAKPLTEMGHRP
jgi:hypothetical protein